LGLLSGVDNRKFPFELSFFQDRNKKGMAFSPFLFLFISLSTLYWGSTKTIPFGDFFFKWQERRKTFPNIQM